MREQAAELHHDRRTNGKGLVDVRLLTDELLDTCGHYTLLAIRAVVGHDDELVAVAAHFVFEDYQLTASSGDDRKHPVSSLLQRLDDGQHRCHAHTASCADDGAETLDMGWVAQGTHHIGNHIAHLQVAEFYRRETHLLHHDGNRAACGVSVGNGQRHAFTFASHSYDNKIAGLAALGNQRSLNLKKKNFFRKLLFSYNFVHIWF